MLMNKSAYIRDLYRYEIFVFLVDFLVALCDAEG